MNFLLTSKKVMKKKQPVQCSSSASSEVSSGEEVNQSAATLVDGTQSLILAELRKLGKRLDRVESKIEDSQRASIHQQRGNAKLRSPSCSKIPVTHCQKVVYADSSERNSKNVHKTVLEHDYTVVSIKPDKSVSTQMHIGEYSVHKSQTLACDENAVKLNRQLIDPSTIPSQNIVSPPHVTKEVASFSDTMNTLESRINNRGGGRMTIMSMKIVSVSHFLTPINIVINM